MNLHTALSSLILLLLLSLCSACGTLVGNAKPVDERAENYGVVNLSEVNSEWNSLPAENSRPDGTSASEVGDVAYQNRRTGSTISLTSGCRLGNELSGMTLQDYTRPILLGITDIQNKTENHLTVSGVPALETTVRGKSEGQDINIRALVLQKKDCVYDLTLIALPKYFDNDVPTFKRFADSLHLKE